MKKSILIRWLSLLLIAVAIIGVTLVSAKEPAPKAAGLVLEDMPIVLPANASEVEKTAAKELQHYLRKMTGSASAIVTEGVNVESAIYLGATKFAKGNNVTYTDNNGNGEGWAIKAIGENLVLTGGEARGTLYAVYHLLEDEFGVHWWNMWEEYVPEREDAVLPYGFESSGEPLFVNRDIYTNESYTSLFFVRNRMNGFAGNAPAAYGGEDNFARPYHVHVFNRYFPAYYTAPTNDSDARWLNAINPDAVDWFVEHPDWYAWSEARQERISYGQMCLSNEELVQAFIDRALIAIEMSYEDADKAGIARPKYIDISPNDMSGHCECPDCKASNAASGPSGHLLKFINKIAAAIEDVYPEITVETLAYWHYFEVPLDDTVPRDNVVIRLASSDLDVIHDLDHSNNAAPKARIAEWAKILQPGQLWLWDYGIVLTDFGVIPNYFRWFDDYRYAYENGAMGVFTEHQRPNVVEFWDLKEWLLTKAMEDPYQDVEALTMEFLRCYYGEAAAAPLYEYLRYMEDAAQKHDEIITFADNTVDAPWLSFKDALKGNGLFEDAIAGVKADDSLSAAELELYLNRINAARGGLDRVILENYARFAEESSAANDPDYIFNLSRQEVGTRMIDGLLWLRSMENEADYTGLETYGSRSKYGGTKELDRYSKYLGQQDPITGERQERPAIPQQVYDDHPGISDNHIHDFLASNFFQAGIYTMYPFVEMEYGTASWEGGAAVTLDYQILFDWIEEFGGSATTYTVSETKSLTSTIPGLYIGDPLINDGEYHLYYVPDIQVLNESNTLFSFFNDVIRFDIKELKHLANEPVDVYLSMKIDGDISGNGKNHGKLFIERVIIVEDCTNYDINYTSEVPATCSTNKVLIGMCPVCGKQAEKEIAYSTTYHKITGDYRYDPQTGKYYADCSVCGEAVFNTLGKLPDGFIESLASEGIPLEGVYDYGVKDFITNADVSEKLDIIKDEDSDLGTTLRWDCSKISESMEFYFKITDTKRMFFAGKVTDAPFAKQISTDGQFHLYKLEDVPLIQDKDTKLIFFDWSLQLNFDELKHLMGRKVDVYFSMKVEGDLGYFDGSGDSLFYYIDRVIVVAGCASHSAETYTWDAAQNAYVGECSICNRVVKHAFMAELPQDVLDTLNSTKSDLSHVHEYDTDSFILAGSFKEVDDGESPSGKAVKLRTYDATSNPNKFIGKDLPILIYGSASGYTDVGTIKVAELGANANKGYKFYKFEGIQLPEKKMTYLYTFDFWLQNHDMAADMNGLLGKSVDIYVSMKIEGDPVNGKSAATCPSYYIDRMILVDSCGNHIPQESMVQISDATCYKGDTYEGTCTVCGRVSEMEDEATRLAHNFGPYETGADGKSQIARCQNDGCTVTSVIDVALPQEVLDDLNADGISMEHVYDYNADSFVLAGRVKNVTDAESVFGKAVMLRSYDYTQNPGKFIGKDFDFTIYGSNIYTDVGTIRNSDMGANAGKGYCIYKFEDVKLPEKKMNYIYTFDFWFQNHDMAKVMNTLYGGTVDIYLSMKITGNPVGGWYEYNCPSYYIDRMILVDNCDNHTIDYVAPEDSTCTDDVVYTGTCPVCKKELTKPGEDISRHVFTSYLRDERDVSKYVAYCDNGCGTTDVKYDERVPVEERLPEALPENVKKHVLFAYSCSDYILSGLKDCYYWDLELDRPVGVMEYGRNTESSALVFTGSKTISAAIYSAGDPGGGSIGQFKAVNGKSIATNTNTGYQLYVIEDVVPVKDGDYNYFYMFSSWVLQIHMLDDDLIKAGYRNKSVNIYLNMKAVGDTSTMSEDKPIYYIDQIIITESCQTDDSWVVTKEATCQETGLMEGSCAVCGLEKSFVVIPKLPHVMSVSILESEATCFVDEYRYGLCEVCGKRDTQKVEGTRLEHAFSNYVLQEDGVTEVAYCDNGCKTRDVRSADRSGDLVIPENIQQLLPIFGGAAGAPSFSFSDIKESDWYFESVKEAWSNKLINGVTATEFRPNETLTVAQAVKLASAYHEMNYTGDVTLENGSGNWYSSYVDYAVENGIIDSKYASKSTAEMNKAIDRSEFVSIFVKAMDEGSLVGYNDVADNAIPDVKTDDENADAIYKFYRAGILTGSDGKGTFNPTSSIKRSEVAAILSRMYNENVRQAITLK